MSVTKYLEIAIGAILINNFIFSQFLGCCPFLGCSSKVEKTEVRKRTGGSNPSLSAKDFTTRASPSLLE